MMISTKGRYALRVMIDLAQHQDDGYISLKEISIRQKISMKYLESIVAKLSKAHLVDSARGKSGGYKLIKTPQEYTIAQILSVTENTLAPVACIDCATPCEREKECLTRPMWAELNNIINDFFKNKYLSDLM